MRQLNVDEGLDENSIKEEEHKSIKEILTSPDSSSAALMKEFVAARSGLDHWDEKKQAEAQEKALERWENAETPFLGRMSPFAKERLYRSYIDGATVKALSLKYGILPQRVKAIIF